MNQWENGRAKPAGAGLSKEQVSKIIGIVLTAVIALLAVFGYQVAVVNPTLASIEADVSAVRAELGAQGVVGAAETPGCVCAGATAVP
jgi:hypothetical protein